MGRPQKEGFGYFPFDTDFFHNPKIEELASDHGPIGLIAFINIMCRVYATGYYCKIKDIESFSRQVAKDIMSDKDQIRYIASKVSEAIHYMLELNLIDRGLFEMNVISSKSMQEQFLESVKKAKRNTKIGSYNLVGANVSTPKNGVSSEKTGVNSEETGVNSEKGTQSKVKENNITTTTTVPACGEREETVETVENSAETSGRQEEPPQWANVYLYMLSYTDIDNAECKAEAEAFIAWNGLHGWSCLPNWKAAVDLWAARRKCPRR